MRDLTNRERLPLPERIYLLLLLAYPAGFRGEFGPEMLHCFRLLRYRSEHLGRVGVLRFWLAVFADLVPSALRLRIEAYTAAANARRAADFHPPPYTTAALAGLAVWVLYAFTLAPTVAFWDAGEYITVAHVLGIPHAPGNPLFVLLARTWELLLAPTGLSTAVRINLFSATLGAVTHALWFLVADRALASWKADRTFRRAGAAAAVALSATAFTVWHQSNVNEKVYTVSLLTVALASWLVFRWRDTGRSSRRLLLVGYVVVLSSTNHLMGLLAAPALLLFVARVDRRALLRPQPWVAVAGLSMLALSVQLFLPIRAGLRPLVSETEPVCESLTEAVQSVYTWGRAGCPALSSTLQREQYGKPSVLADPNDPTLPRGGDLLASQLVNYAQYFDWQWGRSLAGADSVFGGARPLLALVYLALGLFGYRELRRRDPVAADYLGVLFLTLSLGLVLYLNFRFGYSLETDRYPDPAMHEVRERDYFFLIGFSVWGVLAGLGVAALWQHAWRTLAVQVRWPRWAAAPVWGVALLPLALNWGWATRADDYTARDWAYNVLMSVEPYGVLVTNGDNDSFPLWYLQQVERVREDVTIVLSPYLNTAWYIKQLKQLTEPCPPGVRAADDPTRVLCQRSFRPEQLPQPLVQAGLAHNVQPPEDSIIPLSDERIDRIAETAFVAPEVLLLEAGNVRATIPAGTPILPADTFVSAILRATLGERPVHFMAPSPTLAKLGLAKYAVRQGLTYKLHNGAVPTAEENGIVPIADAELAASVGAYVDLPRTDTLLWEVYRHRGRVTDPSVPWVDAATRNIPTQYLFAHYAAAQAHAQIGRIDAAQRHAERIGWWQRVME